MGVSVGDKGIKFTATERCFIYGQIRTDILGIEYVFPGMSELFPVPVIAEDLLVLPGQVRPVDSVMGAY